MNRIEANTEALWDPPSQTSGFLDVSDYTINSATYANIDGTNLSRTITITGDTVIVTFTGVLGGARKTYLDVHVDSARIAGDDGVWQCAQAAGTDRIPITLFVRITGLSAGDHTFTLMWKNDAGGSSTLYGGNGSAGEQVHPKMDVFEVS
jgi:hypothetical protein